MITVRLSDHTGSTIDLRETVNRILQPIKETEKVFLDFSGIVFISRAAADQLLKEKKRLNEKNIEVVFLNVSPNISEMLDRVSKGTPQTDISEPRILEIHETHKIISVLSKLFHRSA